METEEQTVGIYFKQTYFAPNHPSNHHPDTHTRFKNCGTFDPIFIFQIKTQKKGVESPHQTVGVFDFRPQNPVKKVKPQLRSFTRDRKAFYKESINIVPHSFCRST